MRHSRQHLNTHPPHTEDPSERSPDIVQGMCHLILRPGELMTLLVSLQETPLSASIPTDRFLRQVTTVL
jgi:hypothetical protein